MNFLFSFYEIPNFPIFGQNEDPQGGLDLGQGKGKPIDIRYEFLL